MGEIHRANREFEILTGIDLNAPREDTMGWSEYLNRPRRDLSPPVGGKLVSIITYDPESKEIRYRRPTASDFTAELARLVHKNYRR